MYMNQTLHQKNNIIIKKDMNTKIYKVQLCDGVHNNYYYAASDINAIFERKFNYIEKSVELLNDEFIGTCDETKHKLFYVSLTSGRSLYIIANDMKEAYDLLCDNIGNEIQCFVSIVYVAPIQYVKSFRELDNEIETMRIG